MSSNVLLSYKHTTLDPDLHRALEGVIVARDVGHDLTLVGLLVVQ